MRYPPKLTPGPSSHWAEPALVTHIATLSRQAGEQVDRAHMTALRPGLGQAERGPTARWCGLEAGGLQPLGHGPGDCEGVARQAQPFPVLQLARQEASAETESLALDRQPWARPFRKRRDGLSAPSAGSGVDDGGSH